MALTTPVLMSRLLREVRAFMSGSGKTTGRVSCTGGWGGICVKNIDKGMQVVSTSMLPCNKRVTKATAVCN